jgi:hypothetical protein
VLIDIVLLPGSPQQRIHLCFGQAHGSKIAHRPHQPHLRRRVRWQFPLAMRPTSKASQRFELAIDARRL